MKRKTIFGILFAAIIASQLIGWSSASKKNKSDIIPNKFESFKTIDEGGLIGERVDLWRNHRLWYMAESDYLLSGFESRPGTHPWQGEHVGKWLHAATLAYIVTKDKKLKKELDSTVKRLLAAQLANGYLGTYGDDYTFMALPENFDPKKLADDIQEGDDKKTVNIPARIRGGGWDTWTLRYNIYGLLTYENYFPDENIVNACRKMADLLIESYGEGKHDLTKYGTRNGISATTLLESIMMLYERTQDKKYLDFAEHIVAMSEGNPGLHLMGTVLEGGSVVYPGDGKAYQLMANLLGYIRLYRGTGNEKYLQTVLKAWEQIKDKHVLVTGGAWSRHMAYNGNRECFAKTEDFHPEKISVENCSSITWMQLNIHLFELTGMAKYFDQAEVTLYNDTYEHQYTNGIDWCYYTKPNEEKPRYEPRMHCCASSGPRGLEMFSANLAGKVGNNLSVNSLAPSSVDLTSQFGGGLIKIESNFPLGHLAEIHLENTREKAFTLEFRLPENTALNSVRVNGETTSVKMNPRGFFEICRKWEKGDVVTVDMDYKLQMHVQEGEENQEWIAFTYGPIALAQKITEMPNEEPFEGLKTALGGRDKILSMLSKQVSSGADIAFKVQGTDIALVPYYLTGTRESGPKTYFKYN